MTYNTFETTLVGILGRDPEARYTGDGKLVCNMSVAVHRGKDKTVWVQVEAWEKLGEACVNNLRKGSKILAKGTPRADAYVNKEGDPKASLIITAREIEFLSNFGGDKEEEGVLEGPGTEDIPY
ncbi:single-stranded DNA-binding protein [Anaerolinea sp.]|uniref:single-stranded DNA-binding protein n=1 Tax=Anaerolinea sp. TaxID=1872519 RepID=UPI002ACE5934|nr:single-stranded DNA-binding protein [Anaerolinea sp.]